MSGRVWELRSVPFNLELKKDARFAAGHGIARERTSETVVLHDRAQDIYVEAVTYDGAEGFRAEWAALVERAFEPNVFMEPAFALPAAQHFTASQRPLFIAAWHSSLASDRERLIGLWAVEGRSSAMSPGISRGWMHKQAALGLPLLDRDEAGPALDAMMAFMAKRDRRLAAMLMPRLVRTGPTFRLLVTRAIAAGRPWVALEEHQRAALRRVPSAQSLLGRLISPKHRKEIARQGRRLAALGRLTYRSASAREDVKAATEQFLALEQQGWKGTRATALLSDIGLATFSRTMTRMMSGEAKCRIDWLELDGKPIAMAIILFSGGRAYFWKTTYDETYAAFSPGVHLARALTLRQLDDPAIEMTDSCAISQHPMIDRVWPDRQAMADILVAPCVSRNAAFETVSRRERLRRTLREALKTTVNSVLARKRS